MPNLLDHPRLGARQIARDGKCLRVRNQPIFASSQQKRRAIEICEAGCDRLREDGAPSRPLTVVTAVAAEDFDQFRPVA